MNAHVIALLLAPRSLSGQAQPCRQQYDNAYLKSGIFGQPEAIANSRHSVAAVRIPSHILIDALQPNLEPAKRSIR